jgi:hypothetical protein
MRDNSSDEPRGGGKPEERREDSHTPSGRQPQAQEPGRSQGPKGGRTAGSPRRGRRRPTGPIRLAPIGANRFELIHPACVHETELDYEEGLEIWKAGDPEGARDALRYALGACRDNMWIHVALGRIALEEFRDPALARGHFAYAFELGRRALPAQFAGFLPADRTSNRPFHDALEGLIRTLEALGSSGDSAALRTMKGRLSGGRPDGGAGALGSPDPGV